MVHFLETDSVSSCLAAIHWFASNSPTQKFRSLRRQEGIGVYQSRFIPCVLLLGMKDPDSIEARRVMSSSGRLTRTVALDKVKDKT